MLKITYRSSWPGFVLYIYLQHLDYFVFMSLLVFYKYNPTRPYLLLKGEGTEELILYHNLKQNTTLSKINSFNYKQVYFTKTFILNEC